MSVAASVSIDRTSLSLAALTISGDGSGTYSLVKGGLGRPVRTPRYGWMPDHPDIHGSEWLSVALENSALPLVVLIQAASYSALDAAIVALDDALWQVTYTATVTIGGVARTWSCYPTSSVPADGVVDSVEASGFFAVHAVTIPVYPIAS